jgi:hypothetical protein
MLLPYLFALGALIVAAITFWGGYAEERRNGGESGGLQGTVG